MDDKKKDGPVVEDSTLQGFANLLKQAHGDQPVSTDTIKGYSDGSDGAVTPEDDSDDSDDGPDDAPAPAVAPVAPQEPSFTDKLKAVLQAMQMGGKDAVATMSGGLSPAASALAGKIAPPAANAIAQGVPTAVQGVNNLTGLTIPVPAAPTVQTPPPQPVVPPPPSPAPVQTPPPAAAVKPANDSPAIPASPAAPANPDSGPVANMLTTMTGGDPAKLQAVLGQLKDQQTRGQFAKALAIIGDTFGNVGMARGGKEPQGFKGTALVDQNNKDTQANLVDNLKSQLANDPNSQTSKFAQQAAANILGIKPGDPRAAGLARAPAAVLSAQLPPLSDSVKSQLDREAQTIQQKQFEQSKQLQAQQILQQQKDREAQLQIAGMNARTTAEKDRNEVAGNAVEHLSPFNPMNWSTIGTAKNTIQGAVGGGQPTAPVQTVTYQGKQYSKINGQWVAH